MSRPRSSAKDCGSAGETRRFFLHSTKAEGCKKFGICYTDALIYDNQTGINYFLSWADCQRACMTGKTQCMCVMVRYTKFYMHNDYQ